MILGSNYVAFLLGPTKSIVESYKYVLTVIDTLNGVRLSVKDYHAKWYKKAVDLAKAIGVEPKKKRTTITQFFRNNVPADTTDDYFRRSLTLPCLNEVNTIIGNSKNTCCVRLPKNHFVYNVK